MHIFLSYGHDEHASLAERMKRDLEGRGHEVWLDLDHLKPGGDWERYIDDGLNWASDAPDEGRFVLLMTPHSVRRPDGYCLNELARAWDRRLPIIPVMVVKVEPPLSICRLQYLDMRDCVPVDDPQSRYEWKFGQLLQAIEHNRLDGEGVQARLLNYLEPLPYEAEVSQHLLCFTGRDWVVKDLERWLADPRRRVFWITGEAGVGKSALAAWLSRKRPEIAAFHACRYGNSDRVNPRKALTSLAYQLSTQLPDYQQRLNTSNLDALRGEANARAVFERLFVDPLGGSFAAPERPLVILIDALDEATQNGKNELAAIIGTELSKTPHWLRLIVTSRPYEEAVTVPLQALDAWKLDAGRDENLDDIRSYLRRELRPFSGNGEPPRETVEKIVAKSEGLFLYASWVWQEVADRRLALTDVEKFPQGLGGIYAAFFERYFPDPEKYRTTYRPILEAVCAAREPLEVDYLAGLSGLDMDYAETELASAFGSLFPIAGGRVRPFHHSLRDWLTDKSRAGAHFTSVDKGHKRLADYGWNQYRSGVALMARYSVTHLPAHLATCGRSADLGALLLDFDWMEEKLKKTDVTALVSDYDFALESGATDESLRLVQHAFRLSGQVLAQDVSQLAAHLLARIPAPEPLRERILQRALATPRPWLRPLVASLVGERSNRWLRPTDEEALDEVAFSSSGRWAAHVSSSLGAEPRSVVLWDLQEWRPRGPHFRTLPRLDPFALALSDNARWCLYADSIGGVHRLGDAGETWEGHAHRDVTIATLLAISADGRRALSACQHGRLVAWDMDANAHEMIWDESDNYPRALTLDATGTRAVVARKDGTIHLVDLWPGRAEKLCELPSTPTALACSADGQVMVVAAADGHIHVRLVASPDLPIGDFTVDEQPTSVAVSADAHRVAVGTDRGTVEVWSLERRNRAARYSQAHAYEVRRIAFSPDGARVISADTLQIKEWAVEAAAQQESPAMNARAAGEVRVTADGEQAVAVLEDGHLGVWKLRTGALESALPPAPGPHFGDADVGSPKGSALAAYAPRLLAWNDKLLAVWDLDAGAGLGSQRAVDVHDAAITPDGTGVVYVSDMSIILWKLDRGGLRVLGTYEGDRPGYVAISPDGKCALSSGGDRPVHLWRLEGPTRRQKYEELRREMKRTSQIDPDIIDRRFQTRFAPDASYWPDARDKPASAAFVGPDDVIVTRGGGELFTLDLRSERCGPVRLSDSHRDHVCRILVQADGCSFVTSSWDCTVRFWELGMRESLAVLEAHPGMADRVSASAKRMLLRTRDGVLKIVSLPDEALLAAFQADKQIISCDADAELQWVAALDQGGQMHFFRLENSRCLPQKP